MAYEESKLSIAFRKFLPEAERRLDLRSFLSTLQSENLLTPFEYQDVNTETNRFVQTQKVFNYIRGKGQDYQEKFLRILGQPGSGAEDFVKKIRDFVGISEGSSGTNSSSSGISNVDEEIPPVEMEPAMGADSPRDWKPPPGVFTYKPRKPRLWRKYWKSVLRRSKQIHFGRLSIELLMSGIIYFMIILAMWAICPEAESQALESGQADSGQSFPTMMLEALTAPKRFLYYHMEGLWKFFVLFLVVKLSPRLYSWAIGFVSSKGSKKERMIHGRYLLSFDERQKALEGFDKAMCKIFRDGYTATGFVIRYDSVVLLVTSIHSFFEGDEVHSNSNKAYKLLLPDGLNLSETMRSRILDTYSFKFCSGTKHGRDILHNSEGVPNLFANTVRDILVLRLREYPKGVKPIEVSQHIQDKPRAEWVNAAMELLGYHEQRLKHSSGTILPTDNAEESCFHYCANTEPGFSGGPVLVALPNTEHSQLLSLCPLAVHTTAGRDDEPYNIGSYLWPFLMDIKELRQCWSRREQRRPISVEEKEILDKERMVVRSMTF